MLDLGAFINVMPLSVFSSLSLSPLNRSIVQPAGFIEDIFIQVNKLVFPADFYILDMGGEDSNSGATTIILDRPFLKTTGTKIDVHASTLIMEFGDSLVQFNILNVMKRPVEDHFVYHLDILDDIVDDNVLDFLGFATKVNVLDTQLATSDNINLDELQVAEVSLSPRPLPSIIQSPSLELKPFSNHLKYAYLEKREHFE